MDNGNNQQHPIRVEVARIDARELIRQQAEELNQLQNENAQLRNTVDELANTVAMLRELVQQLRDEIARLKGQTPKPDIRPSILEGANSRDKEEGSEGEGSGEKGKKGKGRGKHPRKNKKNLLTFHEKRVVQPTHIPEGAVFKGYRPYTVQDIVFTSHNIQYLVARWRLPDGSYIDGELPEDIHGHYGPQLVSYILYQSHVCRVTEHLLLEQLHTVGVLISAGQLNNILLSNKEALQEEVDELLPAGIEADPQVQVDDTGGRHKGTNQYTTIIGNQWFSVFTTTDSKSRINFLRLLQGGKDEYVINEDTVAYLRGVGAAAYLPGYIGMSIGAKFTTLADWEQFLKGRNVTKQTEIRFVTEAALFASLIANDIPRDLGVHADDAGQFNAFVRSLCWIHEERHYRKLIMTDDQARADLDHVIDQIWEIYSNLKTYKLAPSKTAKEAIGKQFDAIFLQKTSSSSLNKQLQQTYQKKSELLQVLERPSTPLHNNSSETDARSAKIKLKISGGTRSDIGKEVRDMFLSLKQTCLKLKINFIEFLQDRVRGFYQIPRLAAIIRQRSDPTAEPG